MSLTQDDPAQARKATAFIDNELSPTEPGFISLISLVEIAWVMESCYNQSKTEMLAIIHALLTTKQLIVGNADLAYLALKRCSASNGDFSDALIVAIAESNGCNKIVTFDKKAKAVGMTLL